EPHFTRAHPQAAHLPEQRLLLARPGQGQRRLLPAQAGVAGTRRAAHRGHRRSLVALGARSRAAQARARKLPAGGAWRERGGGGGGRGRPGPGPGLARAGSRAGLAARHVAAVSEPAPRAPRIYVSAGEPSGDAHAAEVVAALQRRAPGATIDAFGGPRMAAAGARVLDRPEADSVGRVAEAGESPPPHHPLLRPPPPPL